MKNGELLSILDALPSDANVYFRIPDMFEPGNEIGIAKIEYNSITNEIICGWDCQANYDL